MREIMKNYILILTIILTAGMSQTAYSAEKAKKLVNNAEAFGKLPRVRAVQISPTGKHIVSLESFEGNTNMVMRSLVKGEEDLLYAVSYPDGEFTSIQWKTDDRLVLTMRFAAKVRGKKTKGSRLLAINWDKTDPINLAKRQVNVFGRVIDVVHQARILSILKDDPDHILVSKSKNNRGYPAIYKVNIHTADQKLVLGARNKIASWEIDDFGKILGGTTYNYSAASEKRSFLYNGTGKSPFKEVYTYDALKEDSALYFSHATNNPNVIFVRSAHEGSVGIYKYNVAIQNFTETLALHNKVDISGARYDDDNKLISYSFNDKKRRTVYLDPDLKKQYIKLKRIFRGQSVGFGNHTRDKTQYIVRVSSDRNPVTYYLFNNKTNSLRKISDSAPQIDRSQLSAMKPVTYKASDGLEIPSYLTLPKGKVAKNLPTIIFPHGGPFARTSWGYHHQAQFLASKGYAVLQMNYRGSSEYSSDFTDKGKGEFAGKMITDINDGARWMIKKGYADKNKICIVGWSYGGYAALQAPLVDKTLYKCSVAGAAVTDMVRLKRESGGRAFFRRYIESSTESYSEMSPINHVSDYNLPLLVVHGFRDHQVNYAHSKDMVSKLKSAGKDVRFITLENETHYLDKEKSRIILLKEMEVFLAKHLK